jgi:hypothetical protein
MLGRSNVIARIRALIALLPRLSVCGIDTSARRDPKSERELPLALKTLVYTH